MREDIKELETENQELKARLKFLENIIELNQKTMTILSNTNHKLLDWFKHNNNYDAKVGVFKPTNKNDKGLVVYKDGKIYVDGKEPSEVIEEGTIDAENINIKNLKTNDIGKQKFKIEIDNEKVVSSLKPNDPIKPQHYRRGDIDLMESWYKRFPLNEYRAIMQSHAEKYINRNKTNRVEDLDKAIYVLTRLKEKEVEHRDNQSS